MKTPTGNMSGLRHVAMENSWEYQHPLDQLGRLKTSENLLKMCLGYELKIKTRTKVVHKNLS